jgi:hypothetical protein
MYGYIRAHPYNTAGDESWYQSMPTTKWKRTMTIDAPNDRPSSIALPAGSIPALVRPMLEDGALDWENYRALIEWHIEAGSNAIVVMGSTGEAATVSIKEHSELIRVAVDQARGRIPIIAGPGQTPRARRSNSRILRKPRGPPRDCPLCRTTTNRRGTDCFTTSRRSPKPSTCR